MCCNRKRERGRGYFTVSNSLADTPENPRFPKLITHNNLLTLSALHAFASSGQRFERKSMKKPKTKSDKGIGFDANLLTKFANLLIASFLANLPDLVTKC